MCVGAYTLWSRLTKNPDESTEPLVRSFAHSLAPLTRGKVNDWMTIFSVFFFSILDHSAKAFFAVPLAWSFFDDAFFNSHFCVIFDHLPILFALFKVNYYPTISASIDGHNSKDALISHWRDGIVIKLQVS